MKRLLIITVLVSLLVVGCEDAYKTKQVKNDSDYEVTFTFNHFREKEYTLKPHTSDYYSENNISIKDYSAKPPRVSYTYDSENMVVTFYNTPARPYKIVNETDKAILVTAQGSMDNEPVTVPANSELTVAIYTSKPEFSGVTAVNSFPVNFTYSTNNSTVMVHW